MNRFFCRLFMMFIILSLLLFLSEETGQVCGQEEQKTEAESEGTGDNAQAVEEAEIPVSAPSAILVEASTGKVLYEKNPDEERAPASVTKIMTLLLIYDALAAEEIHPEDVVTVSDYAASMGGSQVFLEPGETQTVETLLKCIVVASANDACVAMAEQISGSESVFVQQMNERAKELGMEHTTFMNCNGLDTEGHVTTARDIARMSRELITTYPQIEQYTTIWMENITHQTKKGSSEFGLTNTNKLIKQYAYATGLKTGSTSQAKYCVSASARKEDIDLIAVVMAAPDYKVRFRDAVAMLDYGFGICRNYTDEKQYVYGDIPVKNGEQDMLTGRTKQQFHYVDTDGKNLQSITRKVIYERNLSAPVKPGDQVGKLVYFLEGEEIGSIPIVSERGVAKLNFIKAISKAFEIWCFP